MKKVTLNGKKMIDKLDTQDDDRALWESIYKRMDGEPAYVLKSNAEEGKYVFCGLVDDEKNKELHYLIEQDGMIGRYIGDRESFDADWENGDYEVDGCIYLDSEDITQTEI